MTRRFRPVLAAIASWAPAAVVLASSPGRWPDLPSTLATHWGPSGRPDGFTTATTMWTVTLLFALLAGALGTGAAATAGRFGPGSRFMLGTAGGVGGASAGLWLATAASTAAAGSPDDARLSWRLSWFFVGLAYGVALYALAGPLRRPPRDRSADGTPPPMTLGPTQQAAWVTVLRSRLLVGATAVAFLVGAVALATSAPRPWMWTVLLVPLAALLVLAEVRVCVDRRGLRLTAGLLRLPFKVIALDRIAHATVEDIDPLRWGGWGYRVMVPGRSAFVTRSGPGLVVEQTNGHRFAVTVRDPRVPAALLNALRDRQPTG
ncbi:DUF1648 domain-containing protein [Asanoa siamensis]|uniref:DUF1648 domain-containing protein n=1 Tax=Asanoa siamensis TaxID=926357 RepID=A0ABQ4CT58_9ACTN|nr:DUF1648 domain-containing protein [Asanoa siamensis]GIF74457.1 hypothetical protein Asi02nite_39750 [Asanoa siamensis]